MEFDAVVDFKEYGLDVEDTSSVTDETINSLGKRIIELFKKYNYCYLKNHGVKANLLDEFMQVSRTFFELPAEVKSKFPMDPAYKFGCVLLETEHLDLKRSTGGLHESFNYTPGHDREWPPVERFDVLAKQFYASTLKLALRFCDVLSLGLDLPIDFMRKAHKLVGQKGNPTVIRSIYYPAIPSSTPIHTDQARIGEHHDADTVSFDFQDNIGGLEIKTPQGEFVQVDPIPGAVLVIVGPLLQRWTAGRLPATVHRILVPEDERRYKIRQALLLFLHPDDDCVVKCLDGSDTYEPITGGEYFDNYVKPVYKPR